MWGRVNSSLGRVITPCGRVYTSRGRVAIPCGRVNSSRGRVAIPCGRVNSPRGRVITPCGRVATLFGRITTPCGFVKLYIFTFNFDLLREKGIQQLCKKEICRTLVLTLLPRAAAINCTNFSESNFFGRYVIRRKVLLLNLVLSQG